MNSVQAPRTNVGVQLSSFRYGPFDFEDRVKAANRFGFQGVELIQWGPRRSPDPDRIPPETAKEILDRYDIEPVAAHLESLTQAEREFDQIAEYHSRLGTENLIVSIVGPEVDYSTRNPGAWSEFGKGLERLATRCRDRGFSLGLHNHVLELLPVDGRIGLGRIFDEVEAEDLFWEADIGHIAASKTDFAELFGEFGDRCKLLHIKDLGPEVNRIPVIEGDGHLGDFTSLTEPVRQRIDWEVDLGRGVIDLERVIDMARAAGTQWLLSESHREGIDLAHAQKYVSSRLANS